MYGRRSLYYDFLLQSLSIEGTSTKQKKRETIIIVCPKILDNEVVLCNHLAFSSGLLIYILIILLFCVEVKISHVPTSLVLLSRCRYRYLVKKMAKQFLVVQIQCQSKILKKWYGASLPEETMLIDIYCEFASGTLVIIIIIFCLICVSANVSHVLCFMSISSAYISIPM